MTANTNIISIKKAGRKKGFIHSAEYEQIASLACQQYTRDENPYFEALLSIPTSERIPALLREYGLKRMHLLVGTMLQEFCYVASNTSQRSLNETQVTALAWDLILVAEEDHFSMEDLIVFFQLAKKGKWGQEKIILTQSGILRSLEMYREERYGHYARIREERNEEVKLMGPTERISPEPTSIKHLFEQTARVIPFKKIS